MVGKITDKDVLFVKSYFTPNLLLTIHISHQVFHFLFVSLISVRLNTTHFRAHTCVTSLKELPVYSKLHPDWESDQILASERGPFTLEEQAGRRGRKCGAPPSWPCWPGSCCTWWWGRLFSAPWRSPTRVRRTRTCLLPNAPSWITRPASLRWTFAN